MMSRIYKACLLEVSKYLCRKNQTKSLQHISWLFYWTVWIDGVRNTPMKVTKRQELLSTKRTRNWCRLALFSRNKSRLLRLTRVRKPWLPRPITRNSFSLLQVRMKNRRISMEDNSLNFKSQFNRCNLWNLHKKCRKRHRINQYWIEVNLRVHYLLSNSLSKVTNKIHNS